jgi:hypothetical protein
VDSNSLQFVGLKAEVFVVTYGAADYNRRASVRGIVRLYCVEDSVTWKPEDRTGRKMCFRDQGYINFVHIEECLEFQTVQRKAFGVPESKT